MFATKFSSVSGRTDHADNGDESLCQILFINRVAPSHKFDTNDIKLLLDLAQVWDLTAYILTI